MTTRCQSAVSVANCNAGSVPQRKKRSSRCQPARVGGLNLTLPSSISETLCGYLSFPSVPKSQKTVYTGRRKERYVPAREATTVYTGQGKPYIQDKSSCSF